MKREICPICGDEVENCKCDCYYDHVQLDANVDRVKKAKVICDPPQGWAYGFPKELPDNIIGETAFKRWLIEEGYPRSMIDKYGDNFCRFWYMEARKK